MTEIENALLKDIAKRIEKIESGIETVITHNEQIASIQQQLNALWRKYDTLTGPEGTIQKITNQQSSCPRNQLKWIWGAIGIVITAGVAGMGYQITTIHALYSAIQTAAKANGIMP